MPRRLPRVAPGGPAIPEPPARLEDVPFETPAPASAPAEPTPPEDFRGWARATWMNFLSLLFRVRDLTIRLFTAEIVLAAGVPGELKPRSLEQVVELADYAVRHPTPLSYTPAGRLSLALARDVLATSARLIHARNAAVRMGTILDAAVAVDERPDTENLARLRAVLNGTAEDVVASDVAIAELLGALDAARAASARRGLPAE